MLTAAVRWAVAAGLYLLLAGQASASEITAGIIVGAAAAAFSLTLRRCARRHFNLKAPWLRIFGQISVSLLRDTGRVAAVLVRAIMVRKTGDVVRRPMTLPRAQAARAGRTALAILAQSVAPNGYVIHADDRLHLHRLARGADSGGEPA